MDKTRLAFLGWEHYRSRWLFNIIMYVGHILQPYDNFYDIFAQICQCHPRHSDVCQNWLRQLVRVHRHLHWHTVVEDQDENLRRWKIIYQLLPSRSPKKWTRRRHFHVLCSAARYLVCIFCSTWPKSTLIYYKSACGSFKIYEQIFLYDSVSDEPSLSGTHSE